MVSLTRSLGSAVRVRAWRRVCLWLLSVLLLCVLLMVTWSGAPGQGPGPGPPEPPGHTGSSSRLSVDCSAIYELDPVAVGHGLDLKMRHLVEQRDDSLKNFTSDCEMFRELRGYKGTCTTQAEEDFPIAYSLVVHKDAVMVERLLRAVYSPTNVFCIHYDDKSSTEFRAAMEALAQCLPNVFTSSRRETVFYGSINRLKADLHCISDLLKSQVQWKYLINLCGQDFPLRSNMELVSELSRLKGGNMLESCRPTDSKSQRYKFHHELQGADVDYEKIPVRTDRLKELPPHGIQMFTGNAYFVLSREFVEFTQTSDVARDFLAWSEDTYSPDEHFWATVARVPGAPGEIPRSAPDITDLQSKTRLVKWSYLEESLYPPCTGEHVRSVCVYGLAELRWLLTYGHWFANKFDPKVDPVILQCLEESLQKKQKELQALASPVCA